MKNLLVVTIVVAGVVASIGAASAIENLNADSTNWVLETFKTGIR